MKVILIILAAAGILLTLLPSILVTMDTIDTSMNNLLMGIGMVVWFTSVPVYLSRYGKKEKKM